jgi:GTPase-associated protein 1, N-terminal domain type 2
MSGIPIEQALYGSQGPAGYHFLARSPGFHDDWLAEAQRLCAGFGERPAGVACPACVFAQPLGKGRVAVVQVADQGTDDAGRPGVLEFHLLVLTRADYARLGGDPFFLVERFPPSWQARGELPALAWPDGPPPRRTVAEVQRVLQRPEGPSLLGGAQALLDGGRLVFERSGPDTALVRDLWQLLPTTTRCTLWPAGFAFGGALDFHALVVAPGGAAGRAGYLSEDQAAEYPEGRYELCLQVAAEAGDQRELDALFARRSRAETWRLGLTLLCFVLIVLLVANWLSPTPAPRRAPPTTEKLDLPTDVYPTLTEPERERLAQAVRELAAQAGLPPLPEGASPEELLAAVAKGLGPGLSGRDPGSDLTAGPLQRRLRALLWQHGVAEYRDPNLNPVELVERLQRQVAKEKKAP